MLEQWRENLDLKHTLSEKSFVCEDHFRDEDILRCFETPLSDGTVHRIERNAPKLKYGSIPISGTNIDICSESVGEVDEGMDTGGVLTEQKRNVHGQSFANSQELVENVLVVADAQTDSENVTVDTITGHEPSSSKNRNADATENSSPAVNTNDPRSEWNFQSLLSSYKNIPLPSPTWAGIVNKRNDVVTRIKYSVAWKFTMT